MTKWNFNYCFVHLQWACMDLQDTMNSYELEPECCLHIQTIKKHPKKENTIKSFTVKSVYCVALENWTASRLYCICVCVIPSWTSFSVRLALALFISNSYRVSLSGSEWPGSKVCRAWWGRRWTMSCRPSSGSLSTWTNWSRPCCSTCRTAKTWTGAAHTQNTTHQS